MNLGEPALSISTCWNRALVGTLRVFGRRLETTPNTSRYLWHNSCSENNEIRPPDRSDALLNATNSETAEEALTLRQRDLTISALTKLARTI